LSVRSFVDIKMRCNFCLNFFLYLSPFWSYYAKKNKSAFFSRGDITLSNQIMARKKNSFVLRMNYSTCTNFFRIFWICGLPNLPCERSEAAEACSEQKSRLHRAYFPSERGCYIYLAGRRRRPIRLPEYWKALKFRKSRWFRCFRWRKHVIAWSPGVLDNIYKSQLIWVACFKQEFYQHFYLSEDLEGRKVICAKNPFGNVIYYIK